MNKKIIVWLGIFVFSCIAHGGMCYARKGPKFKHADKNRDGVISPHEWHKEKQFEKRKVKKAGKKAKKKARRKKKKLNWWEKRADVNEDGIVDKKERAAWKKLEKERIDMDGDGVISPKERRLCWRHARSRVNTKLEKKYDANEDGWLEPDEVREMLKARHALIKSKGKAKVDSAIEEGYDINEDGILDKDEAKAMKKDLKEKPKKIKEKEEQ